jgi:hypothetical protein
VYFAHYPASTVVSTPGDYIRLSLAYMNDGELDGHQLLKPETVARMLTPQAEFASRREKVGLIWLIGDEGELSYHFGHGGAHMFGWRNDFRAYPTQDFAVVVATNQWGITLTKTEPAIIADFISLWLRYNRENGADRSDIAHDWSWKSSYVVGLLLTEQLRGWIGATSPMTEEMIGEMAGGAVLTEGLANTAVAWDPDGVRAAVRDMLEVEMTLDTIDRSCSRAG